MQHVRHGDIGNLGLDIRGQRAGGCRVGDVLGAGGSQRADFAVGNEVDVEAGRDGLNAGCGAGPGGLDVDGDAPNEPVVKGGILFAERRASVAKGEGIRGRGGVPTNGFDGIFRLAAVRQSNR